MLDTCFALGKSPKGTNGIYQAGLIIFFVPSISLLLAGRVTGRSGWDLGVFFYLKGQTSGNNIVHLQITLECPGARRDILKFQNSL